MLFWALFLIFSSWVSLAQSSYLFVGGYTTTVSVYTINDSTGDLTFLKNVISNSVSWMSWLPNANFIYGANENINLITSFSFSNTTGNLNAISTIASGGNGPVSVAVHMSGKYVVTSHYTSGDVVVFPVLSNFTLGPFVAKVNAGIRAHEVVLVGDYVFVPCLGSDYIAQYIFSPTVRTLTPNPSSPFLSLTQGQGPRHLAFHPSLPYAYLISEMSSTVSLLSYHKNGTLSFINQYSTLPPNFTAYNAGGEVLVSADGKYLYASNRGNNSIAIFSINTAGGLKLIGLETGNSQINFPRSFCLSPNGLFMVVANQNGGSITVFSVNKNTGLLTLKRTLSGFTSPAFVGIYSTIH